MELRLFENREPPVPWTVLDIVKVLATLIVLFLFQVMVDGVTRPNQATGSWSGLEWFLRTAVPYAGVVGVVWFFSIRKYGTSWRALGIRGTTAGHLFKLVPAVIAVSWAASAVYLLLAALIGVQSEQESVTEILGSDAFNPIVYVNVIIIGPAAEEILFRGFILAGLVHTIGGFRGAVVASALFAILHLDIDVTPRLFIYGMVLSWLYMRTGSLWPCIAVHGLQNAAASAVFEVSN